MQLCGCIPLAFVDPASAMGSLVRVAGSDSSPSSENSSVYSMQHSADSFSGSDISPGPALSKKPLLGSAERRTTTPKLSNNLRIMLAGVVILACVVPLARFSGNVRSLGQGVTFASLPRWLPEPAHGLGDKVCGERLAGMSPVLFGPFMRCESGYVFEIEKPSNVPATSCTLGTCQYVPWLAPCSTQISKMVTTEVARPGANKGPDGKAPVAKQDDAGKEGPESQIAKKVSKTRASGKLSATDLEVLRQEQELARIRAKSEKPEQYAKSA